MISAKKLLYKIVEKIGEIDGRQALINYPIGSYYETSNAEFDPNLAWGGTWVLETAGLVHIGAGTGYTLGATGGEATVTLTTNQIPSHQHSYPQQPNASYKVADSASSSAYFPNANATPTQEQTSSTGGGQAHNNMQPYVVVNRWHRTA